MEGLGSAKLAGAAVESIAEYTAALGSRAGIAPPYLFQRFIQTRWKARPPARQVAVPLYFAVSFRVTASVFRALQALGKHIEIHLLFY